MFSPNKVLNSCHTTRTCSLNHNVFLLSLLSFFSRYMCTYVLPPHFLHVFSLFSTFLLNWTEKKVMILPLIFISFFVGFPVSLLLYLSLFCIQLSFYLSDERQVEECNEGGHWKPHPEVQGGVLHCSTICPKSLAHFYMISRYEVYHKNVTRLFGHFVRLCLNLCNVRPSC